jgi:hypothetical protein
LRRGTDWLLFEQASFGGQASNGGQVQVLPNRNRTSQKRLNKNVSREKPISTVIIKVTFDFITSMSVCSISFVFFIVIYMLVRARQTIDSSM